MNDRQQIKVWSVPAYIFWMAYPMALSILLLLAMILVWPSSAFLAWPLTATVEEVQLLLVVALAGGLGSTIRLLRIIPHDYQRAYDSAQGNPDAASDQEGSQQVAHESFARGTPFYILRPFLGPLVAVVIYMAIRGGLLSGTTTPAEINVFGMAALGALAGLFSDSATDKLKQVFDVFLGIRPESDKGLVGIIEPQREN